MSNLLKDASILLTPTGYDNGSMNAIKPENGDGDFAFSRNSAATRVNAQGLVENVQILSSNLVSNGNFSQEGVQEVSNGSFSQEGSEEVTNGDFATDSDWDKGSGITISGGSANFTGVPNANINQNVGLVTGKTYKIVFTISNYVSGSIDYNLGGSTRRGNISGDGTFTDYVVSNSNQFLFFQSNPSLGFTGSIDNVSVKEVGQDWDLGTGWSIGEDKATYDGLSGTQQIASSGTSVSPQVGKTYKVSFDVLTQGSGANSAFFGGVNFSATNLAVGSYVFYVTATSTAKFGIFGRNGSVFSITNISVKEVGQDWNLGSSWSIGENKAIHSGTVAGNITQNAFTSGKSYKVKWTQTNGKFISVYGDGLSSLISNSDVNKDYTAYFNSVSGGNISFRANLDGAEVTNISVIEITNDTNIPRINYEGFSYQDALGSELITNGDFATDSDWTKGTGWTIGSGLASKSSGTASNLSQSSVLVVGLAYEVTFTLSNYSNGNITPYCGGTGAGTSRASNGTFTEIIIAVTSTTFFLVSNSTFIGSIDNVSVKEYLGQEVVPDSGCGSWLLEPQTTNLIPYSEDFSVSNWVKTSGATITPSYGISPSGIQNSTRLQLSTSNEQIYISAGTHSGNTEVASLYIKGVSGETIQFGVGNNIGQGSTIALDGNWQRITQESTSGTVLIIGNKDATATDFEIWGTQLEQQTKATSYIPTSGAIKTRLRDLPNNSGNASLINSEEGVLYFQFKPNSTDISVFSISDGSTSNFIQIYIPQTASSLRYRATTSGVSQFNNQISTAIDLTLNHEYAIKWKLNDFSLWVDGIKINSQLIGSTPIGLNQINFYNVFSRLHKVNGKTKALAVFKTALTDVQLEDLRTI